MRKKINQLAKGVLDEKQPVIELPAAPVEETVTCGKQLSGEFTIRSGNGVPFRGLIYTDDDRVETVQNAFAGQSFTIAYTVHGEDISEDTVLEGCFSLVTNGGDISLPYRFTVSRLNMPQAETPGTVRELAELAEKRPEIMLNLFESERFIDLPFFRDDSLRALYPALRRSPDRRLALEEFLVACGAKKPVRLSINAEPQTYVFGADSARGEITVKRDGQGYCLISVQSSAPFIRFPKDRWTGLDFAGDTLSIPMQFLPERMHAGKNLGTVTVNTGREEKEISLTLIPEREPDEAARARSQYRRSALQLAKSLVTLYAAQQPPYNIESQTLKYLDACEALREPETEQKLMRAEIYRQMRRRDEEKATLEEIRATVQRARGENVTQYLWFLYLEEEREKGNRLSDGFLRLLYRLKDEEAGKAELLPLLMRSDSEWAEQPEKSMQRIREHFLRGRFPLMLKIETVILLNNHPELLTNIDAFMRYLLLFGARFRCWNREVVSRAVALLMAEKTYHPGYERLLKLLVQMYPDKDVLTALLAVILRRGKAMPYYYDLYAKGIREDVRLSELYEYYLTARPAKDEEEIPQMVQLYYTYNSPRTVAAQLSLYSYILKQYEPETQMYRLYEKQIRTFALERLLEGTVSSELTVFYEKMFIPQVLETRTASILAELIYTVHLTLANKNLEKILVLYGELKDEFAYPVKNGEAYVPIFTPHCRLLFVDKNGLRYAQNVFKRKRLMAADEELVNTIRALSPDSLPFRLALSQKALRDGLGDAEARDLMRRYAAWDELSDVYRERLIFSLVKRRDLNDAESAALLKALKNSPYLDARAGSLLAESFLIKGEDEAAVEMVHRFGYRSFDPEMLLKLMNRRIRACAYNYDKNIFGVCLSLYRAGHWNPTTLTYLCKYFNGSTADMRILLERSQGGDALYYDLPERLLGQMLFTGETGRIEWVVDLYLKGTKVPNRMLLHAYAVDRSERYFCGDEAVPENIFAYLASWAASEKKPEQLPTICQIALTRYYSGRQTLNAEEIALAKRLLYNLYDQGMFFVYQQNLARFFPLPSELCDKTLIEFRGDENVPVLIGTRLLPQEENEDFRYTEMPHIFRGIYVKPVLLFSDEILEYRIEKREGETRTLVREGRLAGSAGEGEGRFSSLNRVIRAAADGQEGWQEAVLNFGKVDVVLKETFHSV